MNCLLNSLQAVVFDLKGLNIQLYFIPNGDDLFHFKIKKVQHGNVKIYDNVYDIKDLERVMKLSYIHFHKMYCKEDRDYKKAAAIEMPPETYFLNADEFGVYPAAGKLFLGFSKPWFYSVNQERRLNTYLDDLRNAEVLGHLSGWFEIHGAEQQKKYRKELEQMLNSTT